MAHRRNWIPVMLITGISLALLWGLSLKTLFDDRDNLIEREKASLLKLCDTLGRQTSDLLQGIQVFLKTLETYLEYEGHPDPRQDPGFAALVNTFRLSWDQRADIRMVSETGGLFYIPSKDDKPLAQVQDRDYFLAQKDSKTRGFYIAKPVKSRVTGLWGIPVSYPLKTPSHGISVLFAALELPTLNKFYDQIRPKPSGSISLVRNDGIMLTRTPFIEEIQGTSLADTPTWKEFLSRGTSGAEVRVTTATDGLKKVFAYQKLADFPLIITAGTDFKSLMAPWEQTFFWSLWGFAGLSLVILGLGLRILWLLNHARRKQESLDAALLQARQANAAKSQFLAHMSHEVRTPMNGILGILQILPREGLNSIQNDLLEDLKAVSLGLLTILNDILDLSRVESGRLSLESIPFSLDDCINQTLEIVAPLAQDKGLGIRKQIQWDAPDGFQGDPTRIRQILVNLLSNSVKFTAQGGLKLEVQVIPGKETGTRRVELLVEDTGVGMGPEVVKNLFKPFVQGDSSVTRKYGGTGLGLSIVKSLVDMMEGDISVSSTPGVGTSIRVSLVLPEAPMPQRREPSQGPKTWDFQHRLRGLIVDDQPLNLRILQLVLKKWQVEWAEASNGKEALDLARGQDFDFILMDCQMPEMDGYEATREIRKLEGPRSRVRIIAMTAHAMASDRQLCLDSGMDDYLPKPLNLEDLGSRLQALDEALRRGRSKAPRSTRPTPG